MAPTAALAAATAQALRQQLMVQGAEVTAAEDESARRRFGRLLSKPRGAGMDAAEARKLVEAAECSSGSCQLSRSLACSSESGNLG